MSLGVQGCIIRIVQQVRNHAVALFLAYDDDPLFLQIKQARTSVLAPYVRSSAYANEGQRVVVGQRLMQAASDLFLGWTQGRKGRHFYVRQQKGMIGFC